MEDEKKVGEEEKVQLSPIDAVNLLYQATRSCNFTAVDHENFLLCRNFAVATIEQLAAQVMPQVNPIKENPGAPIYPPGSAVSQGDLTVNSNTSNVVITERSDIVLGEPPPGTVIPTEYPNAVADRAHGYEPGSTVY